MSISSISHFLELDWAYVDFPLNLPARTYTAI